MPDDLKPRLQSALELTTDQWWQQWLRELRGSEHLAQWNAFRRRRLEGALTDRLRNAGLSELKAESILYSVRERHAAATERKRAQRSPSAEEGAALRKVAIAAIERMSTAELRELKLPLGIVLDAVNASKP
jgi:hypothetical protein